VDPSAGCGVQLRDVLQEVFGGPGPVTGDQQVAAEPGGELVDRGGEDLEMIRDGVAARRPGAQFDGQALAGVVAPGGQRVVSEGPLVL
jgi:hypothetical protein